MPERKLRNARRSATSHRCGESTDASSRPADSAWLPLTLAWGERGLPPLASRGLQASLCLVGSGAPLGLKTPVASRPRRPISSPSINLSMAGTPFVIIRLAGATASGAGARNPDRAPLTRLRGPYRPGQRPLSAMRSPSVRVPRFAPDDAMLPATELYANAPCSGPRGRPGRPAKRQIID